MANRRSTDRNQEEVRLQKFGVDDSHYERPSHKWVCGRLAEGRPCAVGPDEQGYCNASVECFPLRDGDRWKCTRDRLRGGHCKDGPLPDGSCSSRVPPCLPILNLRNQRGTVTRWLVAASFALILIILNSSSSTRLGFVSPGDLSTKHGKLTMQHGIKVNSCSFCHSASKEGPLTWFSHTAFSPYARVEESALCMQCHEYGRHALEAHSMDPENMSTIGSEVEKNREREAHLFSFSLLNFVPSRSAGAEQSPACASCHREHKGRDADLSLVGDLQCQSCHRVQFNGFSDGHPEISEFSFHRRPRIIFDHQSHRIDHYPDEKKYPGERKEFLCSDCHHVEANGNAMLNPDFESGCKNCHINQILGEGNDRVGLAVFSVPGLDIETLIERDVRIGEWPEFADRKITPFMAALLSTDPEFEKISDRLEKIPDLLDLTSAGSEDLEAVKTLAWSVKTLLYDLNRKGHSALEGGLKKMFPKQLPADSKGGIVSGLSLGTVDRARKLWFPNLKSEIDQYKSAAPPAAKLVEVKTDSEDTLADFGEIGESSEGSEVSDDFDINAIKVAGDSFDLSDIEVDESDIEAGSSEDSKKVTLTPEKWAKFGGWYVFNFELLYRPIGHADNFERLWLSNAASSSKMELFKDLADPKAPGRCVKCHSVDQAETGNGFAINWHGKRPDPEQHEFTIFSHKPHFSLIKNKRHSNEAENKGCVTCHFWNENSEPEFTVSYEQYDPKSYRSNFSELSKGVCSECHTKDAAGESCLTCHNYHIGKFPDLMLSITTK